MTETGDGWRRAPDADVADGDVPHNATLVRQALDGGAAGEQAWRTLVKQNAAAVWKAVWSVTLPAEDRADVFQSTWVRAVERLDQLREPDKFHAWVMTIARNEALAVARRRNVQHEVDDIEFAADDVVDSAALERDERRAVVVAAMRHLSGECRNLVRLLTADPPLTYAEIESLMGWRPGGTAIRRARCIARITATPEVARYLQSIADTPEREP